MSPSWAKRKSRLADLLQCESGDEDAEGLALDRILHGQSVIGKTAKTKEVDSVRFTDKDLTIVGTLEYGQFAVIDVVNCRLDGRVYVRKSIEKRFAFKTRDQCNPQLERDILLQAGLSSSVWSPHLLCAFQTSSHLNLVMDYAEGGTLWDVLESSPHEGRLLEDDLRWWLPQMVSAIGWCHEQGFVHRDVKPHNFVITPSSHVQLIDFGSAAPLLPARPSGARSLAHQHCLVPCGTCDYISPEILIAHEAALMAMELESNSSTSTSSPKARNPSASKPRVNGDDDHEEGTYGVETDWWSMGAMVYEMIYGVAPFFAKDIRTTYLKIMDFKRSLRFDNRDVGVSAELVDLLKRLLTHNMDRVGRTGVEEVKGHRFFAGISWKDLHTQTRPESLHTPQFIYTDPQTQPEGDIPQLTFDPSSSSVFNQSESRSKSSSDRFHFSAFFQPSLSQHSLPDQGQLEPAPALSPPGVHSHETPRPPGSILRDQASSYFIGFSWGPKADAFTPSTLQSSQPSNEPQQLSPAAADIDLHTTTPRANRHDPSPTAHKPFLGAYNTIGTSTPSRHHHPPITPLRRLQTPHTPHHNQPFATPYNRNTNPYAQGLSTIRRTVSAAAGPGTASRPARAVSDREAMRQLVACIGLSARKKVFASGRTPRSVIKEMRAANGQPDSRGSGSAHSKGKAPLKALRFVPAPVDIAAGKAIGPGKNIIVGGSSMSLAEDGEDVGAGNSSADSSGIAGISKINSSSNSGGTGNSLSAGGANASTSQLNHSALWNPDDGDGSDDLHRRDVVAERVIVLGASTSTSGSSVPPSPSPSPRPGSAMSLLSRRSATPTTATGTWSLRLPVSASGSGGLRPSSPWLASGSMSRSRSRSLSEQMNRMDESAASRIWEGESQHGAGGVIGMNDDQEEQEQEEQEVPTPRPPKRSDPSPPHRRQHKYHKAPRDSTHDARAHRSIAEPRSESPPRFVFGEPNNASSPPRPRRPESQQQRHQHHHQPRSSSNPARTTPTTKPATTTTAPTATTTTTNQSTRARPRTSFETLDELDRRYEALMEDLATLEKRMASARRRAATISDYRTR